MKTFLIAILFALPTLANQFDYNSLDSLYDEGSQPKYEEIKGWWSGRCYQHDSREKPLPFLLIASEVKGEDQKTVRHMAVASHFEEDSLPERYDQMSETDRIDFSNYMKSEEFLSTEVSEADRAIYSHLYMGVQALRKSESDNVSIGSLRDFNNSDYNFNCYFFKKLSLEASGDGSLSKAEVKSRN